LSFQKSLGKKEYYCNISVGSINGTTKNTGWLRPFRFENRGKENTMADTKKRQKDKQH
jgi:hypothetical protein